MFKHLLSILIFSAAIVNAQDRCGFSLEKGVNLEQKIESFENWLLEKQRSQPFRNGLESVEDLTYKVPVVIHIIHNGEAIGVGSNIPDEQVFSQIKALNEDFARLNQDTVKTPEMFRPVAAKIGIEFVLAQTDPQGLSTSGITRTSGQQTSYSISSDGTKIKSLIGWDPENYINIWVVMRSDKYLGHSTFPESSLLDDKINGFSSDPKYDGIIINTKSFGSVQHFSDGEYESRFRYGRTATHELGHYFGLYHIWAYDDSHNCNKDDYVVDTPNSGTRYYNRPKIGPTSTSCGSQDMFMNYMDYVDDDYMNLFTEGQKHRMITVLLHSDRRRTLLTSPGLERPKVLDVSIAKNVNQRSSCTSFFTPSILVRNKGEVVIGNLEYSITQENSSTAKYQLDLNLPPLTDTIIYLNEVNLQKGINNFEIKIESINDRQDDNAANNRIDFSVSHTTPVTKLSTDFSPWPMNWKMQSEEPLSLWYNSAALSNADENQAVVLKYFESEPNRSDRLVSPVLDLSGYAHPYLVFNHAYSFGEYQIDKLLVLVNSGCNELQIDTLYTLAGSSLQTAEDIPIEFYPKGEFDWGFNKIDLAKYQNEKVQISFVGISGGGNNIFLDNIKVVDGDFMDLAILGINNSNTVSSQSDYYVVVENRGLTDVENVLVQIRDKSGLIASVRNNAPIPSGQKANIQVSNSLNTGNNLLEVDLVLLDSVMDNNQLHLPLSHLETTAALPFRYRFEHAEDFKDFTYSINSYMKFDLQSGFVKLSTDKKSPPGSSGWVLTPVMDLGTNIEASLAFDIALRSIEKSSAVLNIWASEDGGSSFNTLVETISDNDWNNSINDPNWPREVDWTNYNLDLSEFATISDLVLGFELISVAQVDLLIDNIEFFNSSNPNVNYRPLNDFAVYPNPVNYNSTISFNLDQKQNIQVRLIDVTGSIRSYQKFNDVLNQSFDLDLSNLSAGVYFLSIKGPFVNSTKKIFVDN